MVENEKIEKANKQKDFIKGLILNFQDQKIC